MELSFDAELWLTDGDGGWHFVSLPTDLADDVREHAEGRTGGFGSVRVMVTIGSSTWATSIFPDRRNRTYVLPVKKAVRRAEDLEAGAVATVHLAVDLP